MEVPLSWSWLGGGRGGVPLSRSCTLSKVQKIRVILGRLENSFSLLQWLSMGKQILKHKQMKKTHISKASFCRTKCVLNPGATTVTLVA